VAALRFILLLLIFAVLGLFLLYPHIDWFSGVYLFFSTSLAIFQFFVYRHFAKSEEIRTIFYAQHLDKLWDKVVPLLGILELAVFFDYSHHLIPFRFVRVPFQSLGLLLLLLACAWLVWVDRYFLQNFESHYRAGTFLSGGPFRYIHHPRYAGLALTRMAMLLIFGSIFALILSLIWLWLLHRRIRLEEAWLLSRFGDSYRSYLAHSGI